LRSEYLRTIQPQNDPTRQRFSQPFTQPRFGPLWFSPRAPRLGAKKNGFLVKASVNGIDMFFVDSIRNDLTRGLIRNRSTIHLTVTVVSVRRRAAPPVRSFLAWFALRRGARGSLSPLQLFARLFKFGGQDFFTRQRRQVFADERFVGQRIAGVADQRLTLPGAQDDAQPPRRASAG